MNKQAKSLSLLESIKQKYRNPLIAFSGGKDALVVAHLAKQLGGFTCVCETSFYFTKQLESIKEIALYLGLNVIYKNRLDDNFVYKNPEVLFTSDSKIRSWSFAQRQQKTVKLTAIENRADICLFGRRTQENFVPSELYQLKSGMFQCHPIKDWTTDEVWAYMKNNDIPIPFIYSTVFGKTEGNAPFYAIDKKTTGSIKACWEIVNKVEPANDYYFKFGKLTGEQNED